jgi:hypothetical protein
MTGDDRMPRPLDATMMGNVTPADRKPIIRTIQPRGRDNVSARPIDITDLPKAP